MNKTTNQRVALGGDKLLDVITDVLRAQLRIALGFAAWVLTLVLIDGIPASRSRCFHLALRSTLRFDADLIHLGIGRGTTSV